MIVGLVSLALVLWWRRLPAPDDAVGYVLAVCDEFGRDRHSSAQYIRSRLSYCISNNICILLRHPLPEREAVRRTGLRPRRPCHVLFVFVKQRMRRACENICTAMAHVGFGWMRTGGDGVRAYEGGCAVVTRRLGVCARRGSDWRVRVGARRDGDTGACV